jgi:hypothetical protein
MQDINQGNFADDSRLLNTDGSNTYRMWHDAHTVLLNTLTTTTIPPRRENVGVNVNVFGFINEGVFNPPIVEFRNTTNFNLFDRFSLNITRTNFPPDTSVDDMGINKLVIDIDTIITWNNNTWVLDNTITFERNITTGFSSSDITLYSNNVSNHLQNTNYILEILGYYTINSVGSNPFNITSFNNVDTIYFNVKKATLWNGEKTYNINPFTNPNIPIYIISGRTTAIRGT